MFQTARLSVKDGCSIASTTWDICMDFFQPILLGSGEKSLQKKRMRQKSTKSLAWNNNIEEYVSNVIDFIKLESCHNKYFRGKFKQSV